MRNKCTVDIIGSCVSRDSLSIGGSDDDFEVCVHVQQCNPIIQFMQHIIPNITMEDVENTSKFFKKCICCDINKDLKQRLDESNADWLILDSRVIAYGLCKICLGGGTHEYITDGDKLDLKLNTLKKISDFDMDSHIDYNYSIEYSEAFISFISYIKGRYGNNIILISIHEAPVTLNTEGILVENHFNEDYSLIELDYELKIVKEIGCYYVKPPSLIADYMHKWGPSAVHFVEEYYQYVYKAILTIISTKSDERKMRIELDTLYAESSYCMFRIMYGRILSIRNTL